MRTEGVKWECTRCGRTEFKPYHPLRTKYPEEEPDKWLMLDKDSIHLCPHCAKAYATVLENFLTGGDNA